MRLPRCVLVLTACSCVSLRAAEPLPRPRLPPPVDRTQSAATTVEVHPAVLAPPKATRRVPPLLARPARRAISPEMTVKLSGVAKEAAPAVRARTAGRPLGVLTRESGDADVVQLDPVYVEEERFPEFKERHLLTPKGKLELGYKRHPGLRIGSLPFLSNDGVARAFIEDEFARERKKELEELGGLMSIVPSDAGRDTQRKINETRAKTDDSWNHASGASRLK